MIDPKLLTERAEDVRRMDSIDPALYQKFGVKRGLRNADGTGVLVGLTCIGNVHGYVVSEGEKQPVPGQLFYRGFDVEEIVRGCERERSWRSGSRSWESTAVCRTASRRRPSSARRART